MGVDPKGLSRSYVFSGHWRWFDSLRKRLAMEFVKGVVFFRERSALGSLGMPVHIHICRLTALADREICPSALVQFKTFGWAILEQVLLAKTGEAHEACCKVPHVGPRTAHT